MARDHHGISGHTLMTLAYLDRHFSVQRFVIPLKLIFLSFSSRKIKNKKLGLLFVSHLLGRLIKSFAFCVCLFIYPG